MAQEKTKRPPRIKPYPKIDEVIADITAQLKAKGTYSAALDQTIYLAAVNYIAVLHLQRDIARGSKTYFLAADKNGNNVPKIKPEYQKLPDITTSAIKAFRALGLTYDTLTAADNDPLDTLFQRVDNVDDD